MEPKLDVGFKPISQSCRQVAVTDESSNSVVLSAEEIEAIYFTAKSMGWMNHD